MNDLEKIASQVLKELGITNGQKILDCCCGDGNYTIPAAKLVGNKGKVYSIDRNSSKLEELKNKVIVEKLRNIEIIEEDIESGISVSENVDFILLYDVFWYFGAKETKTKNLIDEIKKIGTEDVLISVFPAHTSSKERNYFKKIMNEKGFTLESEYERDLVHEKHIEEGIILNFRREK
jgi:cyclopropane fatty-acyl-phospholipid synthase-like methyltransferase